MTCTKQVLHGFTVFGAKFVATSHVNDEMK